IDPEEGRINALLEQELRLPEPDEESCRRYFEQNRRRFHTPDLYQASHILVALDKDLPLMQAKARARRQAEALIAELSEHPYRFPDLARRYSACPSRELGGNLGQIGPGQTVAEFESALARMADGEISTSPVESRYGFHIIHLERRIPGQPLDYAAVRERIADYLRDSVYRRAVHQYVQRLIGRAEIHGIELSGADDPLVQ
ncbi:MAG TPA: peptidylprolyl isomerase, partial [Candidatus Competibacteraceae bacterium]|nr:peptidylprolyl isomerase [Candidatus Competibacteraceae bacterium]